MNKKFNKDLLKEELKRFKQINEYTFYTGKKEENIDEADDAEESDLDPVDNNSNDDDLNADIDKIGNELDVDTDSENPDLNTTNDTESNQDDDSVDLNIDTNEVPEEQPLPDINTGGDEVELDVTQLVQGTEEAKEVANQGNQKMDALLNKFGELEGKLANMDKINAKIDKLDHELEKRVPTPKEKLEMQSLNSYPYSLKLTDYWAEKEGTYDVTNNNEGEKKVYTLTKDDVNSGYSENNIKNSFEEEEI